MHLQLLLATPMADPLPRTPEPWQLSLLTPTCWLSGLGQWWCPASEEKGEKVFGLNYLKSKQEVPAAAICSDVPNMPFGSSSCGPALLRRLLEIWQVKIVSYNQKWPFDFVFVLFWSLFLK